ncbi:DUF4573 domain-containing protein [Proteus vulgaris]|uniref:autotransporter domain-containing protein n=1 Tax=Proteus vulgaris TaxID=585 RepID=UPI0018E43FA1|nr:DUF4573 domain-containing protein [Proteus vulgaris]MBI6528085.1 DUF4573 domain-containing protein [Proteus vulgaris]
MKIYIDKLKLAIIIALTISPSYSYSEQKVNDLTSSDYIDFNFTEIDRNNLRDFKSNEHRHGAMDFRNTPNFFSSKYKNIIIISDKKNSKISYNLGNDFEPLSIDGINSLDILSISNDGRYAIGSGYSTGEFILFTYDTYLKTKKIISDKILDSDDYYFTTQDGQYSLYSTYDTEILTRTNDIPFNKKNFFIYDNINNKSIPLNDIDNTQLKNHKEKNRFSTYRNLKLSQEATPLFSNILGATLDNRYFHGLSTRTPKNEAEKRANKDIKIAFIYDNENKKINFISTSEYGSSRINAISKNNIAVGWYEERKKYNNKEPRILRRAYYYNMNDKEISQIKDISTWTLYNNSEATDISEDGNIIIGWVSNTSNQDRYKLFDMGGIRQAFVYQKKENNTMILPSLNTNKGSSEAHSISRDGNTIFGVSQKNEGSWRTVAWHLNNNINKVDQEKERINIHLDTILENKDIDLAQKNFNRIKNELKKNDELYKTYESNLTNELQKSTVQYEEALKERKRIEDIIDQGGAEAWNKYSDQYEEYEDKEKFYNAQKTQLQADIALLNQSQLAQQLQITQYEYDKNKNILDKLQQDKPADTKEPVNPVNVIEPVKPVDTKEPINPVNVIEPAKPVDAKEPVNPVNVIEPVKPVDTKEPVKPTDTKEPINPVNVIEPAKPVNAKEPVNPVNVIEPVKPVDTKEPVKPTDTKEPIKPTDTKEPIKPADTKEPVKPADTKEPVKPVDTKEPVKPADTKEPVKPADTKEPVKPVDTKEPVKPVDTKEPVKPVDTKEPVKPVDTKDPVKPVDIPKIPALVVSKPIDIENTYRSIQETANSAYQFINLQQGRLRYIASATCNVGTEKACISGFTHYQYLDKAKGTQTGLSGAYRFDLNKTPLVVGLAIDTDIHSSLPKGYQYQGYPLPLIGFRVDLAPSLNKTIDNNALHLSLKGAYLDRKISIERQALENTEAGKGNTRISGYHIDLQGYYSYTVSNKFILTPFAGLTFNQISRSAYSEIQNAEFIAHYDALKTYSLLAKMGLGVDSLLGASFILNTKAGLLWNLSHHQGDFRSHIDYLGQQNIDYSEKKKQLKQRPFASVGLTYQFDKHASLNTSANWEMTTYRYHDLQLGMSYTYRF